MKNLYGGGRLVGMKSGWRELGVNDTEFEAILQHLKLDNLEDAVLRLSLNGYTFEEISEIIEEPLAVISNKLMTAKAIMYAWLEKNTDIDFVLSIVRCHSCRQLMLVSSSAIDFNCDACGCDICRPLRSKA